MSSVVTNGKAFLSAGAHSVASLFQSKPVQPQSKPVAKADVGYSRFSLFLASGKEQVRNYAKLINYSTFWVNKALAAPSDALASLGKDMGHFKNCLSFFDLCKKSPEVAGELLSVCAAPSVVGAGSLVVKSSELFTSVADVVAAVGRYVPVSSLKTIANVNLGAALIFSASKAKENAFKLFSARSNEQKMLQVMRLVGDLAYIVFSVVGLTALAAGAVAPVSLMIGCLTAGTVMGLTTFFYEKMYDPENKNESVDFAKMKNHLRLA